MAMTLVEGRSCGDCALCCKLPTIPVLEKPANQWCMHCKAQSSCGIYDTRPEMCRSFYCLYRLNAKLDERWKPNEAGLLILAKAEDGQNQAIVLVDPETPEAWRGTPFLPTFKLWAEKFQIIVCIGDRRIVIFPDHEVDLGDVELGDVIEFIGITRASGLYKTAQLRKAASPL